MGINNDIILNTLQVPVINDFNEFAQHLSITNELLYFLTYQKSYCYRETTIPKKDGTSRILYMPIFSLKVIQKWILTEILEKIKVSQYAMAFVPKKNGIKENAEMHKKNVFILEMDIKNFFGSIKKR